MYLYNPHRAIKPPINTGHARLTQLFAKINTPITNHSNPLPLHFPLVVARAMFALRETVALFTTFFRLAINYHLIIIINKLFLHLKMFGLSIFENIHRKRYTKEMNNSQDI